jgi:acetyltransferase-like isoleucine patch superfamily enzyme
MSPNSETLHHEAQKVLRDPDLSPFRKYSLLALGEVSAWRLLRYELITGLFSACPGALGYALRRRLYRPLFKSMGRRVTIGRNVTFRGTSRISLGDDVFIDDNGVVDARGPQASITIGPGTFIGRNTIIRCRGESLRIGDEADIGCDSLIATDSRLEIGRDVLISAYVYVAAGGAHRYDDKTVPISKQGVVKQGGSRIGDGAWIGAHSLITDGVTIGTGVVVGAHSMVNKSIPDMAIAFGVPARVQRYR